MRSYYVRTCHVAQCVHVISIWVVYVNYIETTLRLYYIYAYFIRERGSEPPPTARQRGYGIRREFSLCLLWRRIHASIFIGRDF